MISLEISPKADSEWNNRLIKSNLSTIYQSQEIALHFLNQSKKTEFIKFVNEKNNIVGQIIINIESYLNKKGIPGKMLEKLMGPKMIARWDFGPLIFNSNYKNEIYQKLEKYLIEKKYRVSGTEHPLSPSGALKLKNLKIIPWSTFLINLQKPLDELYQNISKHNGRKNIERSIKRGVVIEEINKNSLLEYHKLKNEMRKNAGELEKDFDVTKKWWNLMTPIGYSGFIAKKNNQPIGGLLFSHMGDQIIEGGVARSKLDYDENLYSQDLIKWKIIEWGVKNKMKYYNLAGFNPNPQNKKEMGIFKYKKKWGGKRFDYKIIRS